MRELPFKLCSPYQPAGDQPHAIEKLIAGLRHNKRNQVLLGVTGSGKTFTMANIIQAMQTPTLIMAPNKILAAQLYEEMKEFFPENAVEYFVSYYDYYQPEVYLPGSDIYIAKTSVINDQIDRMRHSATRALLERNDTIVVASVSCIYGIGDVDAYKQMTFDLAVDQRIDLPSLQIKLKELHYKHNEIEFKRGCFKVTDNAAYIFPAHHADVLWYVHFAHDKIEYICAMDPQTGEYKEPLNEVCIFPNSHYTIPKNVMRTAMKQIKRDLGAQLEALHAEGKMVEYTRLEQRTVADLEMMAMAGFCSGIENYSRYFTGRKAGEAPPTLFEYLNKNALLIVDESHVAVPQIAAMYRGDAVRKQALHLHGFRLPSCVDNRPLKFEEWESFRPRTIFVSATPGKFELEKSGDDIAEQIVRPTGLIDPVCTIKPCTNQVEDLIEECRATIQQKGRVLVTTLTKKMAEGLTDYLLEQGMRVQYMHSDVETLDRIQIIKNLRRGEIDILIGINLLREGLDIPECSLVAILDADRAGYLRSETSLIQTIGRAARNINGRVILYADRMTKALEAALRETTKRRERQLEYNRANRITPTTIIKRITHDIPKEAGAKSKRSKT